MQEITIVRRMRSSPERKQAKMKEDLCPCSCSKEIKATVHHAAVVLYGLSSAFKFPVRRRSLCSQGHSIFSVRFLFFFFAAELGI